MTGPVDAARTSSVPDGLGQWQRVAEAVAGAGADAMEIGIPFSDPVMDGPVIQEASDKALHSGMTPPLALNEISRMDMGIPLAVMTYYNLVFRHGDASMEDGRRSARRRDHSLGGTHRRRRSTEPDLRGIPRVLLCGWPVGRDGRAR